MDYRTILVELNSGDPGESRIRLARTLAGRFGATLVGMHVMPLAVTELAVWGGAGGAYLVPELIQAQEKIFDEARSAARAAFAQVTADDAAQAASFQEAKGEPGARLTEAARLADVVVAGRAASPTVGELEVVEHLLVAAGVPVLLPPAGEVQGSIGRNVLVGWNGTRESVRAVRDALPLLRLAERVVLCSIGDGSAESRAGMVQSLRRHAVVAEAKSLEGTDAHAGELLLQEAEAQGADLLVMGAYGHSRLRQLVFGGATRHILEHAGLPVLFGG